MFELLCGLQLLHNHADWFALEVTVLLISIHLAWHLRLQFTHVKSYWFRLVCLLQIMLENLIGPGFKDTSPASENMCIKIHVYLHNDFSLASLLLQRILNKQNSRWVVIRLKAHSRQQGWLIAVYLSKYHLLYLICRIV